MKSRSLVFNILARSRLLLLVMMCAGAVLTGMCLVYPEAGFLEWVFLIPSAAAIIFLVRDSGMKLRRLYGVGLLFYMSFFLAVYSWIFSMYPLDFTGLEKGEAFALVLVAWLGIPLLASLLYAFIPVILGVVARGRIGKRYPFVIPFVFAALWAVAEWALTLHWTGVPWGRLCLGLTEMPVFVQSASLLGSYFVSFLIVLVNSLIAYALLYSDTKKLALVTSAALFCLNLLGGTVIYALTFNSYKDKETVTAAAVQGNVSSKSDWDYSQTVEVSMERHEKYTILAKEEGADFVLWPETPITYSLDGTSSAKRRFAGIAKENEIAIFVGAQLEEKNEDDEWLMYNTIAHFKNDGELDDTVYKKQRLVPFGEYLPMRDLLEKLFPILTEISLLDYDFTPGDGSTVFDTEFGRIGALICYDSIFDALATDSVRNGAELFILPTNDSWFDYSRAGNMHLTQAKMRAVENRRFLVRAANTGISAIISPVGEIEQSVSQLEEGYALAEVCFISERTLYSYIGNSFVYLLIGLLAASLVYTAASAVKERKKDKQ